MAETQKPQLGNLQELVEKMTINSKLHESVAAAPQYNYAQSRMQADYKTLDSFVQTATIPDSIKADVAKLNQLFQDTQANILKCHTPEQTQKAWNAGFKELEQKIETAKNSPVDPGAADPKADLTELADKVKGIRDDSLFNETQRMNEKLAEQQRRSMDEIRLQITAMNKYNNDYQMAVTNRWENISLPNADDPERLQEDQNAGFNISTNSQADSPLKGYGTLVSKDSRYNIDYSNVNGNDSFKATYQGEPPIDGVIGTFRPVIQVATIIMSMPLMVVTPIFELCSCLLAGAGYMLSGGKLELPHARPFTAAHWLAQDHLAPTEGTPRDAAKAEISAAQDYAHLSEITLHHSGDASNFGKSNIDRLVIMLDEMKKKSGYTPGNPVGNISNPKDAMGLKLSEQVRGLLSRQTSADNLLSKESEKMLRQMYKDRNKGSDKGFKAANFRVEIIKEFTDYQKAFNNSRAIINAKEDVQTKTNDATNDDASNKSTISKAKEAGPVPTSPGELSTGAKQGEATPTPSPPPSPSSQPGAPSAEGQIKTGQLTKTTFVPSTPEPSAPEAQIQSSGMKHN